MKSSGSIWAAFRHGVVIVATCLVDHASAIAPPLPAQIFDAGSSPLFVGSAQLNGDAFPDVVTANFDGDDLSVFIGNGDGTFQTSVALTVGNGPRHVAIADVNGDTSLDLISANVTSDDVSVLLGNGDGTFQSATSIATGDGCASVAVADVNGDTIVDLVTANRLDDTVSVLLGSGEGNFLAASSFPAGGFPLAVAVVELNGDAFVDVVTMNNHSGDATILLGNGDGTFQTPVSFAVGGLPKQMDVGDLNGDGDIDIVAIGGFFDLAILLGNGDGTFQSPATIGLPFTNRSVEIVDVNGDTTADLVVGSSGGPIILLGNGDGSFQPFASFELGGGANPYWTTAVDLDGDAIADLATAEPWRDSVRVLIGKGGGTFHTMLASNVGVNYPLRMAVADFDEDDVADVVTVNGFPLSESYAVGIGSNSGTFQNNSAIGLPAGTQPSAVLASDLNADGLADMTIVNFGTNQVNVRLGDGNGHVSDTSTSAVGTEPVAIDAGLLNADLIVDLVVANSGSDDISVLHGNGDGTFQSAVTIALPPGSSPSAIAAVDLNGDSYIDIVTANEGTSAITVLINFGGLALLPPTTTFTFGGTNPSGIAVEDLNGDDFPDVVTSNRGSANASVLIGNGNGTFQPSVNYAIGFVSEAVVIADIDGDGFQDVATANGSGDDVSLLLGNGDGTFQDQLQFGIGSNPHQLIAVDVNDDSLPDLVSSVIETENVNVQLNHAVPEPAPATALLIGCGALSGWIASRRRMRLHGR